MFRDRSNHLYIFQTLWLPSRTNFDSLRLAEGKFRKALMMHRSFCTGKMGFASLGLGITKTKLGMGNMSRNYTAYGVMLNDIPELIERLKKYFQFRKSRKRNQRAALTTHPVSWGCFFFCSCESVM